ncbi:MAG: hypothetical protein A4E73_00371 [Syntrophaceae bacterium PtaU1.Bin231]|nr:MAG: hypothetical protein A4E73_00371 [Syntrophaceae bacterium PtaU1.Bin231]
MTMALVSESITLTAIDPAIPLRPVVSETTSIVWSVVARIVASPVAVRLPATLTLASVMAIPTAGPIMNVIGAAET